ncbi:GatB/YqeY domain-containing protein [Chloroflexus sp.]|uniref:GatB/YqeY domain-containing protein n=1 Tax=Chloroflexus sp. TaxID=1904827 RepID=UPI00261AB279|nr:GatB/YqeY domain-containing protein [uncultured Chloroflexus sp.]
MMSIQERLTSDLKEAMRAGDKVRVNAIRAARAALQAAQLEAAKQRFDAAVAAIEAEHAGDPAAIEAAKAAIAIDSHAPLSESEQEAVIAREIKRRRDAADIYHKAGRADLAAAEEAEIAVLSEYLPKMLGPEELRPLVAAVIAELGVSGPAAMGKVMPVLLERFKGKAENRLLSQVARELLSAS